MAQEQAISIPLLGMNQKSTISGGPAGRLTEIENGVVLKTVDGQISVQKRSGFAKLSNEVRTPYDGSQLSSSAGVPTPSLLTSADAARRVVAVDNACKVYRYQAEKPCQEEAMKLDLTTGIPTTTPARYNPTSLTTNTLVSNNTFVSMPSEAAVGNLRMCVWGQGNISSQIPATSVWAEIVDQYGVQVRAPFLLGNSGTALGARIKVISDGTHFWTFHDIGTSTLAIGVYDGVTGQTLAGITKTMNTPGNHYDAIYDSSVGVCVAVGRSVSYGFTFYRFTYATGTITTVVNHDNTDIGPSNDGTVDDGLGFLKSREADSHVYIATVVRGDGKSIFAARLNNDGTTNHLYGSSGAIYGDGTTSDGTANIGGFVVPGTTDIYVYWTQLPFTTNAPIRTSLANFVFSPFSATTTSTLQQQRQGIWASQPMYLNGRFVAVIFYPSQLSQILDPGASSALYGTQPTYFLYDIAAAQIVGSFEQGTAVADFIVFGWTPGTTTHPQSGFFLLADAGSDANGLHLPLIALYQRFSSTFSITAVTGSLGTALSSSLIRDVVFGGLPTRAFEYASETILPGLAAFDEGDLSEQGFWLAPEVPINVTQSHTGGTALTQLATYQWIFVWECLDSRGDLVQSQLSLSDTITLTSTNDTVTFTFPALAWTKHPKVLVGVYRTYINALGVMSTDHRAVFPLPTAPANDPTVNTFSLVDNVPDSVVAAGRPLYADPAATPVPLEYFSPPAFTVGEVFANRAFVVGDNGSVYFSMEKVDGQAIAFHPLLKITLPSAERIRAIAAMDGFLLLGCDTSIWFIQNSGFPNAAGEGSIPTPEQLPFPNGMNSLARGTKDGVFYSSTAGGIWMVGRDLTNSYVGAPVEDDMVGLTILDIVVNQQQQVICLTNGGTVMVWDTVVQQWYRWFLPATGTLATTWLGNVVFSSASNLWQQVPGTFVDDSLAFTTLITLAPIAFASVPGLEMVWEIQVLGRILGRHTINVWLYYDDSTAVSETFSADSNTLYLPTGDALRFAVCPANPECGAIAMTIFDSYSGATATPTAGFSLENIGASVGIVPGVRRIPMSQRIAG